MIHADKIEVGGRELLFSDDIKGGATQHVSGAEVGAMAAKGAGPGRSTVATGGRLVSLVDGKAYPIAEAGLGIGRDASCEVVVAQGDVSRHHARISRAQHGYLHVDQSMNGLYVNGDRVHGSQVLSRSDVITVVSEKFRFYADAAPFARATTAAPARPDPAPLNGEPGTVAGAMSGPTAAPSAGPPQWARSPHPAVPAAQSAPRKPALAAPALAAPAWIWIVFWLLGVGAIVFVVTR